MVSTTTSTGIATTTTAMSTTTYTHYYNDTLSSINTNSNIYNYYYNHNKDRVLETKNNTIQRITPNKYYTVDISSNKVTDSIYLGGTLLSTIDTVGASTSAISYILNNHLNSTVLTTDTTGSITSLTDYTPYGNERLQTGIQSSRKYIGEVYDNNTQLNYLNARYYDANRGQFISQDPVFWSLPKDLLTDPQQLNSYSYARNNPITNKDPLGLFAIKTGTVEKGDTLNSITSLLNKTNSTNYSVSQVAKLNGITNSDKIKVGQILVPNEKVPDITTALSATMKENAKDPSINALDGIKGFYDKVKTGGPWDFKNNPSSSYYKNNGASGYVFDGTQYTVDAPGNINFGYTGNSTWWGFGTVLLLGSGLNQTYRNVQKGDFSTLANPPYFDNVGDSSLIQVGINYKKNNN